MNHFQNKFIIAIVMASVSACTPLQVAPSKEQQMTADSLAWSAALTKKRRVNDNWSADCTTDQIKGTTRCFASTFGQKLGFEGQPYGSKSIPFQVYFLDNTGPYILVGNHTYPGRTPTVRVDNNPPVEVYDNAGVSASRPNNQIVEQFRVGSVVKARYHTWPDGGKDIQVDITGFEEAWNRLGELRKAHAH